MASEDLKTGLDQLTFEPTRAVGLQRLEQFVSRAGQAYARSRNYDFGPDRRGNVSMLSPWLRHRLVTEQEVLARVLAAHGETGAEKFVQEVFWRSYFKGWLEQRPSVWLCYQNDLLACFEQLQQDAALNATYLDAAAGRTGIACFDQWMHELVATGYLHNHVRMWLASIWIFTLRLPWQLGADLFMRHLIDGDPASNTLSWRWVAGLHTKGKTYLARADNIAKYTDGRFHPQGLAKVAEPLVETTDHPRVALRLPSEPAPSGPFLLLITEDELAAPEDQSLSPAGAVGLLATQGRSPGQIGHRAADFAKHAMGNTLAPFAVAAQTADDWAVPLIHAAQAHNVTTIVTAHCPIGPARARLDRAEPKLRDAGLRLHRVIRPYDAQVWPHAKAGFFGLRKKIPTLLQALNLPTAIQTEKTP